MKKNITILLTLILVFSMTVFTSCKKEADVDSSSTADEAVAEADDSNDIEEDFMEESVEEIEEKGVAYDEEQEGAELHKVPSNFGMYIGSWTAPSDTAQFLYGNVDLTIKEDGTWKGNITGEDLGGKWIDEGDHLHMQNKMFSFDLAFSTSGKLILIEKNPDGELHTVLVRK